MITWITDPHFNFISRFAAKESGKMIAESGSDSVIFSGDIAEANSFCEALVDFQEGFGGKIYFILGNHDFYKGSFEEVERKAKTVQSKDIIWLTSSAPIKLNDITILTGHDGWYDIRCGWGEDSHLQMTDFHLIRDFQYIHHELIIEASRKKANWAARELKEKLNAAIKLGYKKIYIATHYPPFPQACWHEGHISDGEWLPWFTSVVMGQMLSGIADDNKDIEFIVLCGHSHSPGEYRHFDNLLVLTGQAEYGKIMISKEMQIG